MTCNHCGSEWTTTAENKKATCPICGKQLENTASSQPAARGRFQLSYDKTTLVQFLGDEKNVVVPAGITRIGAGAFHGYGVETVYIPDGVTEIGDNCFNGCKQLREVRIPSSVTYISDSAFKDTGKKKIIAEKGSYAWNKYAKPVAEDKPVAPTTQAESKSTSKTVSVSPSKPVESAEKSGIPTDSNDSKVLSTVQSAGNKPSAKELYEQQVDEFLALQHKKAQWAQLLGCEPGDRPWIIKASLFVSADKRVKNLIERIKNIHDQELLARIEAETNDGRVRLAAVENITDQDRLFSVVNDTQNSNIRRAAVERITDQSILKRLANNKYDIVRIAVAHKIKDQKILEQMALKDPEADIRMAAMERVTDEKVLRHIAQNDTDRAVRNTALFRIATPAEIKKLLLCSESSSDKNKLSRISDTSDLIDIALYAKNGQIRMFATENLPETSAEAKLAKASAALAQRITAIEIAKFDEAYAVIQKSNPEFLRKIAEAYFDSGVRYLARGRIAAAPKNTTGFEDRLKSCTPSQEELRKREEIRKCDNLLYTARRGVSDFIEICNRENAKGAHHAEHICYSYSGYQQAFEDYSDADILVDLLKIELKVRNFQHATVSRKAHYIKGREWNQKTYRYVDVEKFGGYVVKITTSW